MPALALWEAPPVCPARVLGPIAELDVAMIVDMQQ